MLCCMASLPLQVPHVNIQPDTIATRMGVPITVGRCAGLFYRVVLPRFFKLCRLLSVRAVVCSTQTSKIGRFAFSCFKHTNRRKYSSKEDSVNCCAYSKNQDRAHPHTKYYTPHPCQNLHHKLPRVYVWYVRQRVVAAVHH